jgi:predicted phage terminase large subunit-like protein
VRPHISFLAFVAHCNKLQGLQTPALYRRICTWLEQTQADPVRCLLVFRDAGKSTLMAHYIAWRLLLDPDYTAILISASDKVASRNAALVKKIIETHAATKKLVNTVDLWRSNSFVVVRPSVKLNRSVESITIGADFTGLHADELIADDIETSKSVETSDGRVHVRTRASEFTELAKRIIYVGTPHSSDSIYPELEMQGAKVLRLPVYEDTPDGRVLAWPERFDEAEIERRKTGKPLAVFESQYLLIPANINETLLPIDFRHSYKAEIDHADIPQGKGEPLHLAKIGGKRLVDLLIFWDPASGLAGRDQSVIAILARDEDGNTYVHRVIVLPPVHQDRGYDDQCDRIITECRHHGVPKLLIEQMANQTLVSEVKKAGNRQRYKMDIKRITNTSNKLIRIANSLEPILAAGLLYVHEQVETDSPFLGQCRDFPHCVKRSSHDDAIDAVGSGIEHLTKLPTQWLRQADRISNLGGGGDRVRTQVQHRTIGVPSNDRGRDWSEKRPSWR